MSLKNQWKIRTVAHNHSLILFRKGYIFEIERESDEPHGAKDKELQNNESV